MGAKRCQPRRKSPGISVERGGYGSEDEAGRWSERGGGLPDAKRERRERGGDLPKRCVGAVGEMGAPPETLRRSGGRGGRVCRRGDGDGGRCGGSLDLNPHLHVLVADGVFACREDGSAPEFIATPTPTRDDLREVIARVIDRWETIARRWARQRVGAGDDAAHEDGMEGMRRMAGGRGTFARVDERKRREAEADEDDEGRRGQEEGAKGGAARGLVAERGGFTLHAGVRVEAEARVALERLCRYMARPAVAAGRVSVLVDGRVAYRVKSPRSGEATYRVITPLEFMARLAALVPPPRTPLVRYHGVLAPNSPWRVAVMPLPPIEEAMGGACAERGVAAVEVGLAAKGSAVEGAMAAIATVAPPSVVKGGRIEWARLLWRVWKIDALKCPACQGRMTIIAALTERVGIVRVLEHLGVSTEVPRMRRTRDGP